MSDWNARRIEQLAPDSAAIKAAQGVAKPARWRTLGRDERLIWGECHGSGATPYQVRVDLADATHQCSCPSRKLPCKHALGLLLMLAGGSEIPSTARPAFVAEWLASREKRAVARATRQLTRSAPADTKLQAKRIARRQSRIEEGLDLLDAWLDDVIRAGLLAARNQPVSFWAQMAARLVDCQAPGLARRVRVLADVGVSSPDWSSELLAGLARLQLLVDAYRRIDHLPPLLAAEVRTLIGWTQPQDSLLARPGIAASWLVAGQRLEQEEPVRAQHTWLLAGEHQALLVEFASRGAPLPRAFQVGDCLQAEVAHFEGAPPLRALIKDLRASTRGAGRLPSPEDVTGMQSRFAALLAINPFLERWPMVLGPVVPWVQDETCQLIDAHGRAVLAPRPFDHGWQLLALTQGEPCVVFGEWNGHTFEPLTVEHLGQLYTLTRLGEMPVLAVA